MSPWLYWPLVAVMTLAFFLIVGVIQFLLWKTAVDLYTAWWFKRQCRRDRVYLVAGNEVTKVTPLQANALRIGHQASRRVGPSRVQSGHAW